MAEKKGCARNRVLEGGGSTVYTLAGGLIPGLPLNNAYGVVTDVGCGSAPRPMVAPGQPGLPGMSGGRRRRPHKGRKSKKIRRSKKQRGGRYGFDLAPQMVGQAYNPNQYATVVGMRGETCTPFNRNQAGGAAMSPAPYPPTMDLTRGSYQQALEENKTVYTQVPELVPQVAGGNIVPILRNDSLSATEISGACRQTGGRRSRRARKASKKSHRRRASRKRSTKRSRK